MTKITVFCPAETKYNSLVFIKDESDVHRMIVDCGTKEAASRLHDFLNRRMNAYLSLFWDSDKYRPLNFQVNLSEVTVEVMGNIPQCLFSDNHREVWLEPATLKSLEDKEFPDLIAFLDESSKYRINLETDDFVVEEESIKPTSMSIERPKTP